MQVTPAAGQFEYTAVEELDRGGRSAELMIMPLLFALAMLSYVAVLALEVTGEQRASG